MFSAGMIDALHRDVFLHLLPRCMMEEKEETLGKMLQVLSEQSNVVKERKKKVKSYGAIIEEVVPGSVAAQKGNLHSGMRLIGIKTQLKGKPLYIIVSSQCTKYTVKAKSMHLRARSTTMSNDTAPNKATMIEFEMTIHPGASNTVIVSQAKNKSR